MDKEEKLFKHLEERENNQRIDEKLREMAAQCRVEPPVGYEEWINKILSDLPENEPAGKGKKIVFRMISKPVAAVVAFAIGISAVAVSGGVGYYLGRMSEMTDAEISEYSSMIQQVNLEGDSYSRKYSVQELERLVELQEAYITEDRFPEGSVTMLDKPENWNGDTVAYYAQTRTFYLPEELSDEELLEIVDFRQKQLYSVKSMDSENALAKEEESELDDVQMANIVEAVKVALQMDVSRMYYIVEPWENNAEYMVTFIDGNRGICKVSYERETGKISHVSNIIREGKEKVTFEKAEIQKGYAQIQECLASSIWGEFEIEHATAEYYLYKESNTIRDGKINYSLEGKDGRGYLICYDCVEQSMILVKYYERASALLERNAYSSSMLEEDDLTREIRELQ